MLCYQFSRLTPSSSSTCYSLNLFFMEEGVKNHMLSCSHDRDVSEWWFCCMMGLYGVSDWHAHEVIKEEHAFVAEQRSPFFSRAL